MQLSDRHLVKVKFNEADPLGIVWHGHYIRYFEDGREAFGERFGLSYLDMYKKGYLAPLVSINCDYKRSLKYGDSALVITTFIYNPAAKLNFNYKIVDPVTQSVLAVGNSVQVFLDRETKELQLSCPDFYEEWKVKHLDLKKTG